MWYLTSRERTALISLATLALLGAGLNLYRERRARVTIAVLPAEAVAAWERAAQTARVSLNLATIDELERLPGIGPRLATRIVGYRDRHGPFRALEELERVDGIGAHLLDRLREQLTL